jgi:hypothetical protein
MIQELPPAKHPSEYTKEERDQITKAAAESAVLLAQYLARVLEIDEELRRRGDR